MNITPIFKWIIFNGQHDTQLFNKNCPSNKKKWTPTVCTLFLNVKKWKHTANQSKLKNSLGQSKEHTEYIHSRGREKKIHTPEIKSSDLNAFKARCRQRGEKKYAINIFGNLNTKEKNKH